MANWLGIMVGLNMPSHDEVAEQCGYMPSPSSEMPIESPQFRKVADTQYQCVTTMYAQAESHWKGQQAIVDGVVMIATGGIPLLLVLFAVLYRRSILRTADKSIVGTAAGAIRTKRSLSGYVQGLKTRINEKVDGQGGKG